MYLPIYSYASLSNKKGYDFLTIAGTPLEEDCIQCGGDHDSEWSKLEAEVFCRQLQRVFGDAPEGARFFIMKNVHDFGLYYEAAILFHEESDAAADYAYNTEGSTPDKWDEEAKRELIELEHPLHVAKVLPMRRSA